MRAHLIREVADTDLHQGGGIADGLDVFHVVAGIPPSASGIDVWEVRGCQRLRRRDVVHIVVAVEWRRQVDGRIVVFQVSGRGAKGVGDEVRSIAHSFIEEQSVQEWASVERVGGIDGEMRRGCRCRPGYRDRVEVACGDCEIKDVDVEGHGFAMTPFAQKSLHSREQWTSGRREKEFVRLRSRLDLRAHKQTARGRSGTTKALQVRRWRRKAVEGGS